MTDETRLVWEQWSGLDSRARTSMLRKCIASEYGRHPSKGLLQLAFPASADRTDLLNALSELKLWNFSGGGDELGRGARNWSLSLLQEADVTVLRRHASASPPIAQLVLLHDRLREAASEVAEDERRAHGQRTGGEARKPGRKKGVRWREGDSLRHAFLRLLLAPTKGGDGQSIGNHLPAAKGADRKSMVDHRDRFGPDTTRVVSAIAERGSSSEDRQLCVVSPGKRAAKGLPHTARAPSLRAVLSCRTGDAYHMGPVLAGKLDADSDGVHFKHGVPQHGDAQLTFGADFMLQPGQVCECCCGTPTHTHTHTHTPCGTVSTCAV